MDEQDPRLSARRGADTSASSGTPARLGRGDEARLERLSAYLDGWATDRERASIERELASDPAARELLDDLKLVRAALADLKTPRAPRSFALLAAPPRRVPSTLFRRVEWATRGAAGVAAVAFAIALVSAPQADKTVTSAVPARAEERAAVAVPVEPPTPAGARETDRQTLDTLQPAAAPAADATTAVPAAASTPPTTAPTAGAGGGAAAPAPAPSVAPALAGAQTPVPTPSAPSGTSAPAPAAAPSTFAASGETPTPVATVEATRLAVAPPAAPAATPPATAITPTAAPTPDIPAAKRAEGTNAPAPTAAPVLAPASVPVLEPGSGTTLPAATSEDSGETDLAPALGVLAMLLTLLALVERVGSRLRRG